MPLGPGSRLDAYELVSPLGTGGMGDVWLATEVRLGRRVALKLLPAELTRDSTRVSRFEREARAASALSHPNVCTILALGQTADGQHYIAMEYVEGETLRKRLTTTHLTVRQSLDIATQIASALTAAHGAGIVHRDIKPENVMLRPDGFVKVLDFGLAKLVPPSGAIEANSTRTAFATEAGQVLGTVAYMSPEQARGQEVDARTDIWSLGVVLYEMLAGRSPFWAPSTSEALAAILQNEPAPLVRFEPDAPAEAQRILTKTLRKDRSQRYQTVQDLLLDLQALRDERESHARSGAVPETPLAESRRTVLTRERRRLALAGAAAVLILGGVLGSWWRAGHPAERVKASTGAVQRNLARLTFAPGLQTDVTFSPDGRFVAYASDQSGNFDIWVQPIRGGEPVQVTKAAVHERQPDWSPDSSTIAFRTEADGGAIDLIPALGGVERRLTSGGYRPRFSPDGKTVMYLSSLEHETTNVARPDIYLVASQGGSPRRVFPRFWDKIGAFYSIAWHSDGKRMSFTAEYANRVGFFTSGPDDGSPILSDIDAHVEQPLGFGFEEGADASTRLWVGDFRWNASGTRLTFSGSLNGLRNLWSIDVDPVTLRWRQRLERLTTGSGADVRPALSRDGRRAGFTGLSQITRVWVIPFDDKQGRTQGNGLPLSPIDFALRSFDLSRDGRKLTFGGSLPGGGAYQLWEVTLDTNERTLRLSDDVGRGFLKYSPSSHALAYDVSSARRTIRIIRESAMEERVVAQYPYMYPFDWTPGETAIVGSATDAVQQPWYLVAWPLDAAPHAETRAAVLLRDAQLSLWGVRYSPSGKWICFNAHGTRGKSVIGVATSTGGADRAWFRVTDGRQWADKPRWSPDGGMLYYIVSSEEGVFNLFRIAFDQSTGRTVGSPMQITSFDSPVRTFSPDIGSSEVGVAAGRLALTIQETSGSIWVLDNVDK